MMDKKALLGILEKARFAEEKAIPVYVKHLSSAVEWAGLSSENKEKIKRILHVLAEESKHHKAMVEGFIEEIQAEDKNAF